MLPSLSRRSWFSHHRSLLNLLTFYFPGSTSSKPDVTYDMGDPVIIPARGTQSATLIFLHGLGDTGHGWSSVFEHEIREDHIKYICPHAPTRPVTLNMGMRMPAWYDMYGLTPDAQEDTDGINESTKIVHSLIDAEIRAGIPSNRIIIGGFSMGGALALYAGITYDKPLAGIIGLSSFLCQRDKIPGNHTVNSAIPIFMGHGAEDVLVPLTFGQMTQAYIKTFDPNITIKVYPGMGHSSCPEELRDVKGFIAKRLPKIGK
ncbi:hypothetical protein AB6A40_003721 [Gnathostoma spinigerum]|uniref:palmitoyl-protein hydrolase n=1 Tax=Gnathostoma spinigerum TaxID=75299 RepID=A0ABD6EJZ1_9BILA